MEHRSNPLQFTAMGRSTRVCIHGLDPQWLGHGHEARVHHFSGQLNACARLRVPLLRSLTGLFVKALPHRQTAVQEHTADRFIITRFGSRLGAGSHPSPGKAEVLRNTESAGKLFGQPSSSHTIPTRRRRGGRPSAKHRGACRGSPKDAGFRTSNATVGNESR